MVKKILLVTAGAGLVFALLFGRAGMSYVHTTISEIRDAAQDSVPVEFQIKNARNEIKKLDPEIRELMRNIAREELELDDLRQQVATHRESLDEDFAYIMILRNHLEDGETYFVHNRQSYSQSEVESELRLRFDDYKTEANTVDQLEQILSAREASLRAHQEELAKTQEARHALEIRIENLEAQARLVEVAKTTSEFNFDDSRLSRTEQLLDDIESRLAVEKKVMNVEQSSVYRIPLERQEVTGNLAEEVDAYFGGNDQDFVLSDQ